MELFEVVELFFQEVVLVGSVCRVPKVWWVRRALYEGTCVCGFDTLYWKPHYTEYCMEWFILSSRTFKKH